MKRIFALLAVLALMMMTGYAEVIDEYDYTDAPTAMTQDSVVELLTDDEICLMETLQPDEISIALLEDVYDFVWMQKHRPARYYDEETQMKLSDLLGGINIDILHMTEAMRLQLTGDPQPDQRITATMRLDVDYHVGQLIGIVMGIPQEDGTYIWYPYRGRVDVVGEIKWTIPELDWLELNKQPVSFHVLTDRIGDRGKRIWRQVIEHERFEIISKDAGDVVTITRWYSQDGEPIEDDFRVYLKELTKPMRDEVERIAEFISKENENGEKNLLMDWFPIERKSEAKLMMPLIEDYDAVIAYDVIALMDENYKDTYGDVTVELVFGTAYDPTKEMIVLAGFPIEDAVDLEDVDDALERPFFEWYVLHTEAMGDPVLGKRNDHVEIGLKQLNLPRMEEEPMMLIVISEPLEDTEPEITENDK